MTNTAQGGHEGLAFVASRVIIGSSIEEWA